MINKIRKTVLISVIMVGIIFILTGCGNKSFNKVENTDKIDNLDIASIEYSVGGGFGTEAECATKTITIKDDGSTRFTNGYNESIVEEFEIDEASVKELEEYINENREVFLKKDITDEEALDASSRYIVVETKDEKIYKIGGYCVIDEQFNGIANKILEIVGVEEYREYCKNVENDNYIEKSDTNSLDSKDNIEQKGYEILGSDFCEGYHMITAGDALTPWTCELCGYSDVNPDTDAPKICNNCAKKTGRCQMCGNLKK